MYRLRVEKKNGALSEERTPSHGRGCLQGDDRERRLPSVEGEKTEGVLREDSGFLPFSGMSGPGRR